MCYFSVPDRRTPLLTAHPTTAKWQDLPRRTAKVKAVGWLCEKTLPVVIKVAEFGPLGVCFATLAFSIAIAFLVTTPHPGMIATIVGITGILWPVSILVVMTLWHTLDKKCRSFLGSDFYQQEKPLGLRFDYYEVDYWLAKYPHLTDTVAQWALANNGTLQRRHLATLRAQEGREPDYVFIHVFTPQLLAGLERLGDEGFGLERVGEGELLRAMQFLELNQGTINQHANHNGTAEPIRRL